MAPRPAIQQSNPLSKPRVPMTDTLIIIISQHFNYVHMLICWRTNLTMQSGSPTPISSLDARHANETSPQLYLNQNLPGGGAHFAIFTPAGRNYPLHASMTKQLVLLCY